MHLDLQDGNVKQGKLGWEPEALTRDRLMTTLDKLNERYCRGTVRMASADVKGPKRNFEVQQNLLTPQYTTRLADMPVTKAN